MIGIPAVRHSDTEPVGQTNRPIFIYRFDDSDDDVITVTIGDEVVKDWYSEVGRVSFKNIEAGQTLML